MQLKFVAAQKRKKETETQQTLVKWIARFYYLGIYTPAGSACVLFHTLYELPIDMATLSALLINIISGFFPVVFA